MLLVLERPVADFAEPVNEDRPRQAVAGFAFVELLAGLASKFKVLQPVEGETASAPAGRVPAAPRPRHSGAGMMRAGAE